MDMLKWMVDPGQRPIENLDNVNFMARYLYINEAMPSISY